MFVLKSVFIIERPISDVKELVNQGNLIAYEIVNYRLNEFDLESKSSLGVLMSKNGEVFKIGATLKLKAINAGKTEITLFSSVRPEIIIFGVIFSIISGYLYFKNDKSFPNIILLFLIVIVFFNFILKAQEKGFHTKIKRFIIDSLKLS